MSYLDKTYTEMGIKNDPPEDYFETDSRFLLLEKTLRSLPPGNFCDLGCGRGLVLRRMRNYHACYGTDFDPGAVQHCQSQGLTVAQIDLNEASQLPFPNIGFDVILIGEVLEHLLDPQNALQIIQRHLNPGGTLIVTVPNALPLCCRFKLLFGKTVSWLHYPSEATIQTGHIRFYTAESMSRMLRQEGLVVEKVHGVLFRYNGHFWARLCYWLPRLFGVRSTTAPTKMDLWLCQMMPGLSAGLFIVCKKP